jgi:hypothetical protein
MLKSILGAAPLLCLIPIFFPMMFIFFLIQMFIVNKLVGFREQLIDKAIQEQQK